MGGAQPQPQPLNSLLSARTRLAVVVVQLVNLAGIRWSERPRFVKTKNQLHTAMCLCSIGRQDGERKKS
jgi:hypothetical protein